MTRPTREELVDKYFVRTPVAPSYAGPLVAIAGGGSWMVIGLILSCGGAQSSSSGGLVCLGIPLLIGGGYGLVRGVIAYYHRMSPYRTAIARSQPKATGWQMDAWRQEGIEEVVRAGRKRLNLGPADPKLGRGTDTLVFVGMPNLFDYDLRLAPGEDDGVPRFSMYSILVVYLTDWRLSTYESVLDMATGDTISHRTKEFHLPHVDGVETHSDRVSSFRSGEHTQPLPRLRNVDGGIVHLRSIQALRIMVSGRPAVELLVGIAEDQQPHHEGVTTSDTDQMVAQLRERLRQHLEWTSVPGRFWPGLEDDLPTLGV
jgi:hypothetical protein